MAIIWFVIEAWLSCVRLQAIMCICMAQHILLVLVLVKLFRKSKLFVLRPSRTNNNRWVGRTCFTYTIHSIQYDFVASSIPSFALSIESGRVSESLCRATLQRMFLLFKRDFNRISYVSFCLFSLSVSKVADRVFLFFNFPYRSYSKSDFTQRRHNALEI